MGEKYEGVVLTVNPGACIPEEYLLDVLVKNPTCGGIARVLEDGTVDVAHVFQEITPQAIRAVEKSNTGKFPLLIHLGNFPPKFQRDCVQPFILLQTPMKEKSGKSIMVPLVAVCLDGDFSQHRPGKPAHSDEFYAVNGPIVENVRMLFEAGSNKIDALHTTIGGEYFKKTLARESKNRSCVAFLTPKGMIIHNKDNGVGLEAAWGFTSNAYGYTEHVPESDIEIKPEDTQGSFVFGRSRALPAAGSTPKPEPTETEDPDDDDKDDIVTGTPVPPKVEGDTEIMPIPPGASNRDRKNIMRRFLGIGKKGPWPTGWQEATFFTRPRKKSTKDLAEVKDLMGTTAVPDPGGPDHVHNPDDPPKDMPGKEPTIVPGKEAVPWDTDIVKKLDRERVKFPIISPEQRKNLNEWFERKDIVQAIEDHIAKPHTFENKRVTFWERMEVEPAFIDEIPYEVFVKMSAAFPYEVGLLLMDLRDDKNHWRTQTNLLIKENNELKNEILSLKPGDKPEDKPELDKKSSVMERYRRKGSAA